MSINKVLAKPKQTLAEETAVRFFNTEKSWQCSYQVYHISCNKTLKKKLSESSLRHVCIQTMRWNRYAQVVNQLIITLKKIKIE